MTKLYTESSREAIDVFHRLVKGPLQQLLGGEVFSVEDEAQAGAPVAKVLDQSASADLVLRYQANGAIYVAGSRILHDDLEFCHNQPLSLTLRNSVNKSYERTELNKLQNAVRLFRAGVPVVIPRYLCFARVYPKESPTHVYDIVAIETIPLIENIFEAAKMNLPGLRRQMDSGKVTQVLFDSKLKALAGIRTSGENTFLFLNKRYVEQYGIPHLYSKV